MHYMSLSKLSFLNPLQVVYSCISDIWFNDENYEKIIEQGIKVFTGVSNPAIAEDDYRIQEEFYIKLIVLM